MKRLIQRPFLALSFFLTLILCFVRYQALPLPNGDLALIQTWYDFLKQNGLMGLANGEFSNYPPAYLYLLWLSTLFLDSVPAIKLIPTGFDIVSAITIYKIARLKFKDDKPYLLAVVFLLLPTVTLNSTGWGQIDSAYASFLLVCFYFLLKEKPLHAMLAFGVAFSFKAQSIFLLPFLGIMLLRKKIRWYYFFIVPAVYILLALPSILLGRSWESVLFLYVGQVGQFENLSRYAPNLYFAVPNEFYHPVFEIGMGIFLAAALGWAWVNWKAGEKVTQRQIAFTALASAALIPFLLPKMHDRYFYPADVFSYAVAVLFPEIWFVPMMFQISSTIAYSVFLFGAQPIVVLLGSLINTALVIVIMKKQIQSLKEGEA